MIENNIKLDSIFEALSVASEGAYVFICNLKTNLSRWSKAGVDFFGLPNDKYIYDAGRIWGEKIHPDDSESYFASIDDIFSGKISEHNQQYRVRMSDGTYMVCTCNGVVICDNDGKPEFFSGVIRNNSSYEYIDAVTSLRSLYGYLDDIKGLFNANCSSLIIMVGLSSFSDINDVHGFLFGNKVLQKLTRKLQKVFSENSSIYRMGGTRFAIITRNMNPDEAEQKFVEIQEYLQKDFYIDSQKVTLALNGGAILADRFDISWETFYSCLRYAYRESKYNKSGGFVFFDDIVNIDNRKVIEKINAIRNSITDDCKGFYLCYQPIVNSETEEIIGAEALIRWKNDEYGEVPPNEFIPILEQDPLFPVLGKWIMRQAMVDGNKFLEYIPNFTVNINLSYSQLKKNNFVNDIFEILEQTKFPLKNLCLEITERCRLLDIGMLKDMFSLFRNNGIKIAVDDFGTGFSSLGFIRSIPVDVVKIDKDFVVDIMRSSADRSSVKFISELADAFSAKVCAEGIENSDVRDCLKEYNIQCLQGYYYSKPISAEDFIKKIIENKNK